MRWIKKTIHGLVKDQRVEQLAFVESLMAVSEVASYSPRWTKVRQRGFLDTLFLTLVAAAERCSAGLEVY